MVRRKKLDDVHFAKKYYKEKTGKSLDLDNPRTFDEKLWYLKLNYRNPLETICSDKYRIREYVEKCEIGFILNELYGVYDRAEDIDFDTIPSPCFIKTNHGCGTNVIFDRERPFDKTRFVRKFNKSLESNYYDESREWNYKNIKPKIIVEKVLRDENGSLPNDYKFFCFAGVPKLMIFDTNLCLESGEHNPDGERRVYDADGVFLPDVRISRNQHNKELDISKECFNTMKKYAAILSKPFPYVRVDFYCIDSKIYLGEMTFYHMGGCNNIEPHEFDLQLGSWISISNVNE